MDTEAATVPRDRDEESGKFTETYPPGLFVETLRESGPTGTQNVADELGCSYELAYRRLRDLEDEGRVTSDRVGNARLWSAADAEEG